MIRTCANHPGFRHGRRDRHGEHEAPHVAARRWASLITSRHWFPIVAVWHWSSLVASRSEAQASRRHWSPLNAARRPPAQAGPGAWSRLARELALIATLAVAYEEIAKNMVQAGAAASRHAMLVVDAERALGIFHEHAVQSALIGNDTVIDGFNAYYGGTHFLIPAVVLGWLLFRHPAHYGRARTALAVITGLAFISFWLFPVAPPRLLPARYGIVDTLVTPDGSGHFDSMLLNSAGDVYASMPSVHVAWAVWSALALFPVVRHPVLRALAVAYPLMTVLVVVATGNHFFLDAIAGTALACGTWAVNTRAGARLSVELATWHARHGRGPTTPAVAERPAAARPAAAVQPPAAARPPVAVQPPATARPPVAARPAAAAAATATPWPSTPWPGRLL